VDEMGVLREPSRVDCTNGDCFRADTGLRDTTGVTDAATDAASRAGLTIDLLRSATDSGEP